ncbi:MULTISPECIES: hypothetical protein [Pseudanabaena]|uniref:GIY-YIG domain-containing protein n=2 Tax=Pseudanabaena TaxID=1152 RepID=L8N3E5_9CYAN|nr:MULTISPECIES: hypothetical protein [Pseudanabaena]ELS32758.1 hypothetical protein Pse7429DRAFT_2464 [Pseudanabaena biceps PCC 7429]MDG3495012.1 hypothetical protein [Pseudanabaena catenata USMAC16]
MPIDFAARRDSVNTLSQFNVKRFILSPENWRNYPNRTNLNWNKIQFLPENANQIPDNQKGIYSFVVSANIAQHPDCSYLFYVGKTVDQNFKARYKQYLYEERKRKPRMHVLDMLKLWENYLWFCYVPIDDDVLISQLEDDLIEAFLPPVNRQFPVTISDIITGIFS